MVGKASALIFLLSVNIFAEISMIDELRELHNASESVELSDWQGLVKKKTKKKKMVEDSVEMGSSALQKSKIQKVEQGPTSTKTIRYRSR